METKNIRPWGYYQVLSMNRTIKSRIVVVPGEQSGPAASQQAFEHWYAVAGKGMATIDGRDYPLSSGQAIDITQGAMHRLENNSTSDLVIIEVQTGTYFGEDDIERLEDKYGRV